MKKIIVLSFVLLSTFANAQGNIWADVEDKVTEVMYKGLPIKIKVFTRKDQISGAQWQQFKDTVLEGITLYFEIAVRPRLCFFNGMTAGNQAANQMLAEQLTSLGEQCDKAYNGLGELLNANPEACLIFAAQDRDGEEQLLFGYAGKSIQLPSAEISEPRKAFLSMTELVVDIDVPKPEYNLQPQFRTEMLKLIQQKSCDRLIEITTKDSPDDDEGITGRMIAPADYGFEAKEWATPEDETPENNKFIEYCLAGNN